MMQDAFIAFLSIVELSSQQLHQTKFLRQCNSNIACLAFI